MTNDIQDSFNARLKARQARLEAQGINPETGRITRKKIREDTPKSKRVMRMVVWVGLALIAVAFFSSELMKVNVKGVREELVLLSDLAEDVAAEVSSLNGLKTTTLADNQARTIEKPLRELTDQGAVLRSPAVLGAEGEELELSTLVKGYPPIDGVPGEVTFFDRNETCDLRDALPEETIRVVQIRGAGELAPITAFSNETMASHLLKYIRNISSNSRTKRTLKTASGNIGVIDVVVTDTSGPLYLVLASIKGALWNLHLAKGVTIAHVAMISAGQSALVAPPSGASYEAIRVGDFITEQPFGYYEEPRECAVYPWRMPAPAWGAVRKADAGNTLFKNQIQTYEQGGAAFTNWRQGATGVDAPVEISAAKIVSHILLGPVPADPPSYRSIAGSPIVMTRVDNVVTGAEEEQTAKTLKIYESVLTGAAGGDLSAIFPPEADASAAFEDADEKDEEN